LNIRASLRGRLSYLVVLGRHYRIQALKGLRFFSRHTERRKLEKNYFVTLYLRSKQPLNNSFVGRPESSEAWAIVMQGPIRKESNYTYHTLRMYREWFPRIPIVFSTWDNQDKKELAEISALGCQLLISDSSKFLTPTLDKNFNRQMHSSHLGLLLAKESPIEFALKTRSDQRIYNPHSLLSLPALLGRFETENFNKQKKRIAVASLNTFALRLYGLSDMFTFGHIDDLLGYWDGRLDLRPTPDISGFSRSWASQRSHEVGIAANFLELTGEKLEWSLANYWDVLARRFLVVDSGYLDLHWPKHRNIENRWSWNRAIETTEVTFAMWLGMYEGRLIPDETLLEKLS
jgi:hypothetical protein